MLKDDASAASQSDVSVTTFAHVDVLAADPRWQLFERVVMSRSFQRSPRLVSFLTYVVERELLNRGDEITEQQIGVHVFGRPANYSPGEDNIVRTTARMVRQRLDQFFFEEGTTEPFRLSMPRGAYVPLFESRGGYDRTPDPVGQPAEPASSPRISLAVESSSASPIEDDARMVAESNAWRRGIWAAAVILVMGSLGAWAFWGRNSAPSDLSELLWKQMFGGPGHVLLVPGDSGLVMTENLTNRAVGVAEYASGSFRASVQPQDPAVAQMIHRFGGRRYTSVPDLEFAIKAATLPEARSNPLQVRYARDLNVSDLKGRSVILVGDPEGNPWVQLYDHALNFHFEMDEPRLAHLVINRQPKSGELPLYRCAPDDKQKLAYALVALLHNPNGQGRIMLVEGTTMAGIDAASDFLFDRSVVTSTLRPAWQRGQGLRDFEVLLETRNIDARGPTFRVIGVRVH